MNNRESLPSVFESERIETKAHPRVIMAGIFVIGLCSGSLIPVRLILFDDVKDTETKLLVKSPAPLSQEVRSAIKPIKVELSMFETSATVETPKAKPAVKTNSAKANFRAPEVRTPLSKTPEKPKVQQSLAIREQKSTKSAKNVAKASHRVSETKTVAKAAPSKVEKIALAARSVSPELRNRKAEIIEETPSILTAQQVQKLMQVNKGEIAPRYGNAKIRQVSLPAAALIQAAANPVQAAAPLNLLKNDPNSDGKSYPMILNNASFSKANLGKCQKHCALSVVDALGNRVRAVYDGAIFRTSLAQHNGTINLSGQPRLIKNKQVFLVENISFNLSSAAAKTSPKVAHGSPSSALPAAEDLATYTNIPSDSNDLKPGSIIRNRKQISIDASEEIPVP